MTFSHPASTVPCAKTTVLAPRNAAIEEASQIIWVPFYLEESSDLQKPFRVTLDPRSPSAAQHIAFLDAFSELRIVAISPVENNSDREHYVLSPYYMEHLIRPLQDLIYNRSGNYDQLIHDPRLAEIRPRFAPLAVPYPEAA